MKRGSLRRIYELDRMIRLGKLMSAEQAAGKFEVSTRTIERDLEQLLNEPMDAERQIR
jgi:predicted DNA-binding transcriptional regulator YafY